MPCAAKGPKVEWAGQLPVSGVMGWGGVGVRCGGSSLGLLKG